MKTQNIIVDKMNQKNNNFFITIINYIY